MKRIVSAIVPLLCFSRPAATQDLVWERIGGINQEQFGGKIAFLGDVDGDGYADLLHEMPTVAIPGPTRQEEGQLWILSGRDGSTLRIRRQYAFLQYFARIAATGDVDRDGSPDYATTIIDGSAAVRPTIVEVRSARDDRLIWQVTGAQYASFGAEGLLGDLDLDGDGRPDLVVTAAAENDRQGAVYAYSNRGTLLYRTSGAAQGFGYFGRSLGKVGDIDRDGCDDFVVGAVDQAGLGVATVVSGRTGAFLVFGYGEIPGDHIGFTVDGCGDINGDGVLDFCAASWNGSLSSRSTIARMFSGTDGAPLFTWANPGPGPYDFGEALVGKGIDLDRDGVPDVMVGGRGQLVAYSGRDGSLLLRSTGAPGSWRGQRLDARAAQPGSPFAVFAVSDPIHEWNSNWYFPRGRLQLYRGPAAGLQVSGASCRGTLSTFPRIGLSDRGTAGARIHVSSGAPGSPALLLLGLSNTSYGGTRLPLDLNPLGFPGCLLLQSVDLVQPATTGTAGIAAGYTYVDIPIPLAGSGTGAFTLFGQWLSFGSGSTWPGGLSEGMSWRH